MNHEIKLWKEKTKGIFHITEYTRFWNYITNLQQENQRLQENNSNMQEEMARVWEENERIEKEYKNKVDDIVELTSRIYKAIEYIENPSHEMSVLTYQNLLDILQGD